MTDRELDAAVAEKVMGWTSIKPTPVIGQTCQLSGYPPGIEAPCRVWYYSTDIAAAWEVVEKMRESPTVGTFHVIEDRYGGTWATERFENAGDWIAYFGCNPEGVARLSWGNDGADSLREWQEWVDGGHAVACDASLPRAICLAALAATGEG